MDSVTTTLFFHLNSAIYKSLSFRQNPINPVELYLRGFLLLADFFLENSSLRLSVVIRLRRSSSVNARHFGKNFSNP